jgi:hypothetical protein
VLSIDCRARERRKFLPILQLLVVVLLGRDGENLTPAPYLARTEISAGKGKDKVHPRTGHEDPEVE